MRYCDKTLKSAAHYVKESAKSYEIMAYLEHPSHEQPGQREMVFSIVLSCSHGDVKDLAMHTFNNIERTMHHDAFMLDGERARWLAIRSIHDRSLELYCIRPIEIHEACAPVGWGRVIV